MYARMESNFIFFKSLRPSFGFTLIVAINQKTLWEAHCAALILTEKLPCQVMISKNFNNSTTRSFRHTYVHTPPNFWFCARRKVPARHFSLQNLPYFIQVYEKSTLLFCFSFHATLLFPLMNALVYVDIDQSIDQGKQ